MALSKARKEELVAEYVDLLQQSRGIIFTEYRGMTNQNLNKLRRAVRDANGAFHVAKLTLFKLALEEAGYPIPNDLDGTPLAVGFALGEMPAVAKKLKELAKDSEMMKLRSGIMDGQIMSLKQVEALADLPPIETLRAQLLGLLDAPASSLVGVIQAGVSQVVNVLHAYTEKNAES